MKSSVIIVYFALLAAGRSKPSEDVVQDGRSQMMISDDPFEEQVPSVRVINRYNDFIGGRLPSIQTSSQPGQTYQVSPIPIQISPNTNQISPNPNQISLNPKQLGLIPNQPIANPNVLSPNPTVFLSKTNCGDLPCPRTWFVCQMDSCQYPIEFEEVVLRSRSSLHNGEEQFQAVADLLLTVSGKMVKEGAFINIVDVKSLLDSARTILVGVGDNVVSLEQFLTSDVVGLVAEDILFDLESLQTALRILVEALIEVNQNGEVKIPSLVYDRAYRPRDWAPSCSGRWPCTKILIYPTRFAYAQQRPGCGCQRAGYQYGRVPQDFIYQQSTPMIRQMMPVQQVIQSQPLPQQMYGQSSQVFGQPQYQTITYQTALPVAQEQTPPAKTSVFSSSLSKKLLGIDKISQNPPQPLIQQSNTQPMYVSPQYQVLKHYQTMYPGDSRYENIYSTPLIRNSLNPNSQQIIYSQPQFQEISHYRPSSVYSTGGETIQVVDDPNLDAQLAYAQYPQNTKYLQGQQIISQQPIYAQMPFPNVNQYRATLYSPMQSGNELDLSLIRKLDNSTNLQHPYQFLGSPPMQQPYPGLIQYQTAHYTTGARSLTGTVFNASTVKGQENSTHQQQYVEPQKLGFGQQHQPLPSPHYAKVQIQYQPAKYLSGSRSLHPDNDVTVKQFEQPTRSDYPPSLSSTEPTT
ncbi:hypothetical protein GE061_015080 [Apolygus lucorum]|uniref:Uncharacterized protein n=1 Tax=Apolygus lucorum TaxID=248454 RepID=A0A6A4JHU4_APOLU|nr:hypothetical protein GE061_015080 [Apolygus lucorum]